MTRKATAQGLLLIVIVSVSSCDNEAGEHEISTRARITHVCQAIELFQLTHGRYPRTLHDLWKRPDNIPVEKWPTGGYLRDAMDTKDAWGRELVYREPGSEGFTYDVISLGERPRSGETCIRNREPFK